MGVAITMAEQMKRPTPAQKKRLEQVGRAQITRWGKSWVTGSYHCSATAGGGLTYTMMLGLHEAGWVDAEPAAKEGQFAIVLTDAGRAAIAKTKR
jgi:hypothetical protein